MNMTYRGKIGRLPPGLREEVNRRLERGEQGASVAKWLNGLPEARALLAAEFGGRPVREQNVSDWRHHGYRTWLRRREAEAMGGEVAGLQGVDPAALLDNLAAWTSVRYLLAVRGLVDKAEDGQGQARVLHEFCGDVVALRRDKYADERLKLEREYLERQEVAEQHRNGATTAGTGAGGDACADLKSNRETPVQSHDGPG
jgi:hypothetical protein